MDGKGCIRIYQGCIKKLSRIVRDDFASSIAIVYVTPTNALTV